MTLALDQYGVIATKEDMSLQAVSAVEFLGVAGVEPLNAPCKIRAWRSNDEVVVRRHQAVRAAHPVMPRHDGVEEGEESKTVAVVAKERPIGDRSSADVIRGARELKAGRTRHLTKIGCEVSARRPLGEFRHRDVRLLFRGLTRL